VRVVVINHVSLDGVLQAPGGAEEDTRDGFAHGGWAAVAADDEQVGPVLGARMGEDFCWLFGRRSYDDMLGHWNEVGGPFKDGLNRTRKYVATRDPDADLPWPNTTALSGDVPSQVAELRAQPGGNLVVMGSGELVRSLLPRGLVDEMLLMIHPVVLGSGHRLFGPDEEAHRLELVECVTTVSGVLLATYRAA
jgi:dihydrofolate reductase